MSEIIASLFAEIGAKTDGFEKGASSVKTQLTGLSADVLKTTGTFNNDFKNGLMTGKASMKDFGNSLVDQADKAGLSTKQIQELTGATGIYSKSQLMAAESSANVAAKAEELTQAVAKGEMTAQEAGEAFKAYSATQKVTEASTISLSSAMMIGIPIILAVASALYSAEKAADAAARGDARLEAVIKSTGAAAGYNFQQLDTMAQGLSKLTGVDDDVIKKSQAVQLTFTNIGKDAFPKATKAALDLSAVLGGDLQSATIQVDKALNDFSGYTALKRAGVSFSDEQIKQIKNFKATNDLAGYQNLILAELSKEFGGAAEAIHNAGDKSEDVAIAWGNLTENAGGGLVPALRGVNVYLTESIDGWNTFFQGLNAGNNQVTQTISSLGSLAVAISGPIGLIVQSISVQGQAMDAANNLAAANLAAADATDQGASANQAYVPTAEEVEAANKAISDQNLAMIGTIQSMQNAEDGYTQKYKDLSDQRAGILEHLTELRANNWGQNTQAIQDEMAKLGEIRAKEADLAKERDKQTLQFVSNILAENLARDGWTQKEFDAFAKQQEAWGLWSADVVEKAKNAWTEADKITDSINNIPPVTNVAINVQTNYSEVGSPPTTRNPLNQGYATGGPVNSSGAVLVGEHGPELVNLPTGSFVHPNSTSMDMMGSSGGITINIVYNALMDGADERQVAQRLEPAITQVLRSKGINV